MIATYFTAKTEGLGVHWGRERSNFLTDLGKLSRLAGRFFYTSELNEIIEFDPYGKLARLTTKEGRKYRVERGASLTISDEHGNKLVLSEGTNHQLLRAQTGVYPLSTHTTRNSDSLR